MPPPNGSDRRKHPRVFEHRQIKLKFADYAIVFAESLDHSRGGLRLSHPPHFKPRLNDKFSIFKGSEMLPRESATVVAITPAGVHLQFAA